MSIVHDCVVVWLVGMCETIWGNQPIIIMMILGNQPI